jgi:hypothetical protein
MSEPRKPIISAILSVVIALIKKIPTRAKCRCCDSECVNGEDNISTNSNEPNKRTLPTIPEQSKE